MVHVNFLRLTLEWGGGGGGTPICKLGFSSSHLGVWGKLQILVSLREFRTKCQVFFSQQGLA